MIEKNKKTNSIKMIGIAAFVIALLSIGATASYENMFISGDFWSSNGNTVVLTNTSNNVNIGQNATTSYKLNVNGIANINKSLHLRDGLSMYNTAIGFNNGVTTPPYIWFYNNELLFTQSSFNVSFWLNGGSFLKIYNGYPTKTESLTISEKGDLETSGSILAESFSGYGVIPIGSVQMWCGDMYGLSVPDGFQVCNGSLISDIDSSLYGYHTPNMTDKFIKGASQSNSTGGNNSMLLTDNNMYHRHTSIQGWALDTVKIRSGTGTESNVVVIGVTNRLTGYIGSTARTTFDNQPSYFTVVYIIRIK